MELYQVRAFVTVARLGNATRAAEILCVTQPAVTAQLKGLEHSLGLALFERNGGKLSLTRAGERLLPFAEELMRKAHDMQGWARQMRGALGGVILLGVPGESADFLRLGALAIQMQQALPLVDLRTTGAYAKDLVDSVRAGAVALAYTVGIVPPQGVFWHALCAVRYHVAVPKRFAPLLKGGGWRALAGLPWVDGPSGSHLHKLLRGMLERHGLTPTVAFTSQDTANLDAFVRAGSGCALLREDTALLGVERQEWEVWGHGEVDAQLYLAISMELSGDPLVVALTSVIRTVWQPPTPPMNPAVAEVSEP